VQYYVSFGDGAGRGNKISKKLNETQFILIRTGVVVMTVGIMPVGKIMDALFPDDFVFSITHILILQGLTSKISKAFDKHYSIN